MTGYSLKLTRKTDEDEAGIYAYIDGQFGDMYAEYFRARFIGFYNVLSKQPFIERPAKNDTSLKVFVLKSHHAKIK